VREKVMKTIHENISEETQDSKNIYRDRIELLRSRVELLVGRDRLLMTMYLKNGNSFRQMSRLAGVNETTIARRIHKVTKRLIDGVYITCLRNRDKFTDDEMTIAKDYFMHGLAMKKIAAKRHCSYYRIRQILKKIQGLVSRE
jgi:DNA-directed RNA polymerase specialized sigma subunit